jgi:hypothetical protein
MARPPVGERIARTSPLTRPPGDPELPDAEWSMIEQLLRARSATTWLSVAAPGGVHVRPLFAAWTGSTFVFASNASSAKSGRLDGDGRCSLAVDLGQAHLVVEGTARHLTDEADLERASEALHDVYGWPTTVRGDHLDAPYAAPTSGGPPFRAYEIKPRRAYAFPTDDQFEPTRFDFT